jgi:NCS1 family nucleobase:cation symporter-1
MSKEKVQSDVAFNLVPASQEEREYSTLDFVAIQITFGIAGWFFLTGSIAGQNLPLEEAIPVILFGNVIPLLLLAPMAILFARYGVEQFIGTRAVFGHRGSDIWLILYILTSFGWITTAGLFVGRSIVRISNSAGLELGILSQIYPGASIYAVPAVLIGVWIAWKGPRRLKWFTRLTAITLIAIIIYFMIRIFFFMGVNVWALQPPSPADTLAMSRAIALEASVGLGFSWAFWYGQWARLAKSEGGAFHGFIWGWGVLSSIAGVFAAVTTLVTGAYDPTAWFTEFGGPIFTILGLILFAVANIGSIGTIVYPFSITIKSRFPDIKWTYAIMIVSVPPLILGFLPGFFSSFNKFLSIISLLTGIYGAIIVGDLLLSKGKYNLRAMYNRKEGYQYTAGFNINGFVAMIFGFGFYLWTYNPITGESINGLFSTITAGIPSYLLAICIYVGLAKITNVYSRTEESDSIDRKAKTSTSD